MKMNRKLLASLLLVGLLVSFLPILSLSVSAETELQINTKEDLLNFANRLASGETFAKQTVYINADLDMAGGSWPLSGKNNVTFSGMLDGRGHTLSGVKSESESNYQGLFGSCLMPVGDNSFTVGIRNLTVKASSVSGTTQIGGLFGRIGSDAGTAGKVLFENLNLEIAVSASGEYCGGIAGDSRAIDMIVCNTAVTGTVKSGGKYIGGFFGQLLTPATEGIHETLVAGCVFDGTVQSNAAVSDWSGVYGGGFVGIVGTRESADIAGILNVRDSAFYGTLISTAASVTHLGGFVGATNNANSKIKLSRVISSGQMGALQTAACGNNGILVGIVAGNTSLDVDGAVGRTAVADGYKDPVEGLGIGTVMNGGGTKNLKNCVAGPGVFPDGYGDSLVFRFKTGAMAVDLSDTFLTTPATKPLPMGVLHFYSDVIGRKDDGTAVTNAAAYQDRLETDGTRSVRLIGLLRCTETELADFESVGLEITVIRLDGADVKTINNLTDGKAPSTQTVYKSVIADGEKKDAGSILSGYSYLFTATVDGLPQNRGNVTFAVRSFHDQNGTRTYDDMLVFEYSTDKTA